MTTIPTSNHCDNCGRLFWHAPTEMQGIFCSVKCAEQFEVGCFNRSATSKPIRRKLTRKAVKA